MEQILYAFLADPEVGALGGGSPQSRLSGFSGIASVSLPDGPE
ncbi:hypothetical protein [Streptomyces sp. NPDC059816]